MEGVSRRDETHADGPDPSGEAGALPAAPAAGPAPGPGALARVRVTAGHPHHLSGQLEEVTARPATGCASRWRALDGGRPRRGDRVGQVGGGAGAGASRRGDCEIVSVDSMCVYRGMDIGTSKPDPPPGPRCRTICSTSSIPTQEFRVTEFQAGRPAGAGRHRATRPPCPAGRRDRALPAGGGGRLRDPRPLSRGRGGQLEAELDEGRSRPRDLHARLAELDPVGAGRMAPTNRRSIVHALEVTIGAGRPFSEFGPGLEAYPATGTRPDRASRWRRRRGRPAHRGALRRMVDAGLVDEVRALAARPGGHLADRAPGPGLPGDPAATSRRGCPLEDCVDGGRPAHPPVRPPPGLLVPA